MFGLRKIHFTRQKVNLFKVKFKISVLWALPAHTTLRASVVKFLVFSVEWIKSQESILHYTRKKGFDKYGKMNKL